VGSIPSTGTKSFVRAQAAKVAPFAAVNAAYVRKSAAGDFSNER
jgi:hypothetical protein